MEKGSLLQYQWEMNKKAFLAGTLFVPMGVLAGVLQVYLPKVVLAELETGQTMQHMCMVLLGMSVGLIICILFKSKLSVLLKKYGLLLLQKMDFEYAEKLLYVEYDNLEKQEFRQIRDQAKDAIYGGMLEGKNIYPVKEFMTVLSSMLMSAVTTLFYGVMLGRLNPFLILLILVTTVGSMLADSRVGEWQKKYGGKVADSWQKEKYIRNVTGDFSMAKDIRLNNMEPWLWSINRHYSKIGLKYKSKEMFATGSVCMISVVLTGIQNICAYAFLLYKAWYGEMPISDFVLYAGMAGSLSTSFVSLSNNIVMLRLIEVNFQKFADFIGYGKDMQKGESENPHEKVVLELKDVYYRFPGEEKDILRGLNLSVKSGEKLAVVGLNGAGKTTLMKLLCGLLTPTTGRILLNGMDMQEMTSKERYRWFACAFQDISFLPFTIRENIAMCSKEEADEERIWDCLERAGIKEKILKLPMGLDTLMEKDINEDAVDFSGGERQKLILARALYQDKEILILDEPTAALDPLAENEIYQQYSRFAQDKLSFFVSHRLSSTRFCDRILLLQDGKFMEEGTHEELLELGGLYAQLFALQSHYYQEGGNQDGAE